MTNGDRIRNMSDEELTKFLNVIICNSKGWCQDCPSMYGDYCNGFQINVGKRLHSFIKSEAKN